MRITRLFLRRYKSFNINTRGYYDRPGDEQPRPWNVLGEPDAAPEDYPFIEIPISPDITTVVGANESGKSHLLDAISKVLSAGGLEGQPFRRTDICRFPSANKRYLELWPQIGAEFKCESADEFTRLAKAAGIPDSGPGGLKTFRLFLAPDGDGHEAQLYLDGIDAPIPLDSDQLENVRAVLPSIRPLHARAALSDAMPLETLLHHYGSDQGSARDRYERRYADEAAAVLSQLNIEDGSISSKDAAAVKRLQEELSAHQVTDSESGQLELLLFRDVLQVPQETLETLHELSTADRGYVDRYVQEWNASLRETLNLTQYWQQDEKFELRLACREGMIFFEITDKTCATYSFAERSAGLRYFLSYYIQAKAMELAERNRNCVILMDEPDSFLSVAGQRNLLAIFESLVNPHVSGADCQLVFATHSPFLINKNYPWRIRVVRKEDVDEGTQYLEEAAARRYEPVRSALGLDCGQTLFLGATNIVLEGPVDQLFLAECIRLLSTPDELPQLLDLNTVVMVSANGAPNAANVVAGSQWGEEPVPTTIVLLDGDQAGKDARARLTGTDHKKLLDEKYVFLVSDVVESFGSNEVILTIEDVVPRRLYSEGVRRYVERWRASEYKQHAAALTQALERGDWTNGAVAAIQEILSEIDVVRDEDYDKIGVMQEVLGHISELVKDSADNEDLRHLRKNVRSICGTLRTLLVETAVSGLRESAAKRVKRVVRQFCRTHRKGCHLTEIDTLLLRLDREAVDLAGDAIGLLEYVAKARSQVAHLVNAGQRELTGDDWVAWSAFLDGVRGNPLSPKVPPPGSESVPEASGKMDSETVPKPNADVRQPNE